MSSFLEKTIRSATWLLKDSPGELHVLSANTLRAQCLHELALIRKRFAKTRSAWLVQPFRGEVENAALAEQIASETKVKVVDTLHLETLTDGAPAATYIEMMKHNTTQIVDALK